MKRFISIALICILSIGMLAGCDRRPAETADDAAATQEAVNFAPETTNVPTGIQQLQQEAQQPQPVAQDSVIQEPVAQDVAATQVPENVKVINPVATATPQPNAKISGFSQVTNTGLGFKFSYPTGWNNIPGRSTVCYVQPMEDGTLYPARVAVTMKKMPHKTGIKTGTAEIVEYLTLLRSQYDESTFEVDEKLDDETKFMGNDALSTGYLAYDGDQEIQGYIIMTWFDKYLFVYHFLCACEDYPAFETAMRQMRDSVEPDEIVVTED